MKAAATPHVEGEVIASSVPQVLEATTNDVVRAILLGVGIMAVAYTYWRIWLNFKSASPAG